MNASRLVLALAAGLLAPLVAACGLGFGHAPTSPPTPPAPRLGGLPLLAPAPQRHHARHYGVHPMIDTDEETTSSFGLDVDTASVALVREALAAGLTPPPEIVRVESLVNAPGLLPPAPTPSPAAGALALDAEAFPSPLRPGHHVLRLTVRAGPAPPAPPARLLVAVAPEAAAPAVAAALRAAGVRPAAVHLTPGPTPAAALARALALLDAAPGPTRLLLASDGRAPEPPPAALLAHLAAHADRGAPTLVLALDLGRGLDDAALVALAEAGGGPLLGPPDLAPAPLAAALRALAAPAATDVTVTLRLRADAVARFRLVGHEHRLAHPALAPPSDLPPGCPLAAAPPAAPLRGALLAPGQSVTVLHELRLRPGELPLGAVELRWRPGVDGPEASLRHPLARATVRDAASATPHALAALAIAAWAEKLRGSFWARDLRWSELAAAFASLPPASRSAPAPLAAFAAAAARAEPPLPAAPGDTVGGLPPFAPPFFIDTMCFF